MLILAGANTVSVVLFGALYLLAATGALAQPAFLTCLAVLFGLATFVWVRTEARHRGLEPVRRFGRVMIGLVLVVLVTPVAVLMPIFWLESQLPAEADFQRYVRGIMVIVLVSLALTAAVNVVGGLVIGARALVHSRARASRGGSGIH